LFPPSPLAALQHRGLLSLSDSFQLIPHIPTMEDAPQDTNRELVRMWRVFRTTKQMLKDRVCAPSTFGDAWRTNKSV